MGAKRMGVGEMWTRATLAKIKEVLADSPDSDERPRRIDALVAWFRSTTKPGVVDAVREGIDLAVEDGMVNQEEADRLRGALSDLLRGLE